jgi:hypothetical protein
VHAGRAQALQGDLRRGVLWSQNVRGVTLGGVLAWRDGGGTSSVHQVFGVNSKVSASVVATRGV